MGVGCATANKTTMFVCFAFALAGIPDSDHVLRRRDHQQEAAISHPKMGRG